MTPMRTTTCLVVLAGSLAPAPPVAAQAPAAAVWEAGYIPHPVGVGAVAIAASTSERFALEENGDVWWWNIWYGAPARVPGLTGVAAIAALDHCAWIPPPMEVPPGRLIATLRDGTVHQWTVGAAPAPVARLAGVVALAGFRHTLLAVTSSGTVWQWNPCDGAPFRVPRLADITAVAAGEEFGLALSRDGSLWGWGANNMGQLGDGTTESRSRPVRVGELRDVVAVAAGENFGMALTADGRAWRWGGLDYYRNCYEGTLWPSLFGRHAVAIGAGLRNGYVVRRNGSTWAWGSNRWGELGAGFRYGSCDLVRTRLNGTVAATSSWFGAMFLVTQPRVASVSLPRRLAGCRDTTGLVTLAGPVPQGKLRVTLSADSPDVTVPASITLRAGHRSASFPVLSRAVDSARAVTITADAGELGAASFTLRLAPMGVHRARVHPSPVAGGTTVSLTIALPCAAAPGDVVVALSSSDPAAVPPPQTVVPAGEQAVVVPVTTRPVASETLVTLRAAAPGGAKTAHLVLTPP